MDRWNVLLAGSLATAVLVDVAAPLVLAIFLARRYRGRWRYWFYGVLVFLVFQVLTRVPAMVFIQAQPGVAEALKRPVYFWLFLLFAAATAGLFEEGGRWLAFRLVVPQEERRWRTALMLGAGHGGLESILVGLVVFGTLVAYLAITLLPPETFAAYAAPIEAFKRQLSQSQGWEPLLGAWERLNAMAFHVALSVMVLEAFRRGPRWWWYALAAHTLVDFTAPGLLHVGAKWWGQSVAMLATEGLVTVYGLLSIWFVVWMRNREPPEPAEENEPDARPCPA